MDIEKYCWLHSAFIYILFSKSQISVSEILQCQPENIYVLNQENFYYLKIRYNYTRDNNETYLINLKNSINTIVYQIVQHNSVVKIYYNGENSDDFFARPINRNEVVFFDKISNLEGSKLEIINRNNILIACFNLSKKSSDDKIEDRAKKYLKKSEYVTVEQTNYIWGKTFKHTLELLYPVESGQSADIKCNHNNSNPYQNLFRGSEYKLKKHVIYIKNVTNVNNFIIKCVCHVLRREEQDENFKLPLMIIFITKTEYLSPAFVVLNDDIAQRVAIKVAFVEVKVSVRKIKKVYNLLENMEKIDITYLDPDERSRDGIKYVAKFNAIFIDTTKYCGKILKFILLLDSNENEYHDIKPECSMDEKAFMKRYMYYVDWFDHHHFVLFAWETIQLYRGIELVLMTESGSTEVIECTFIDHKCIFGFLFNCTFNLKYEMRCDINHELYLKTNYVIHIYLLFTKNIKSTFHFTYKSYRIETVLRFSEEVDIDSLYRGKRIISWTYLPPFYKLDKIEISYFVAGQKFNPILIANIPTSNFTFTNEVLNVTITGKSLIFHDMRKFPSTFILKFNLIKPSTQHHEKSYVINVKYLEIQKIDINIEKKNVIKLIRPNSIIVNAETPVYRWNSYRTIKTEFQNPIKQYKLEMYFHDQVNQNMGQFVKKDHQFAILFRAPNEVCNKKLVVEVISYSITQLIVTRKVIELICIAKVIDFISVVVKSVPVLFNTDDTSPSDSIISHTYQVPVPQSETYQKIQFKEFCNQEHANIKAITKATDNYLEELCILC